MRSLVLGAACALLVSSTLACTSADFNTADPAAEDSGGDETGGGDSSVGTDTRPGDTRTDETRPDGGDTSVIADTMHDDSSKSDSTAGVDSSVDTGAGIDIAVSPDTFVDADTAGDTTPPCLGAVDGTTCTGTPRHICLASTCVESKCGDKFVDIGNGEECDDGNTISGDGCEPTCKFTCHDAADCTTAGSCTIGRVCDATHICSGGSNAPDLNPCKLASGSDGVCDKGTCVPPGCTPPVTCGVGACLSTAKTCDPSTCTSGTPTPEVCNGIDDDCNGKVDDGLPLSTCGVGACARTGTTCAAASCAPGTPTPEVCNGIDDDCNGRIDDGIARSCYDGPSGTSGVGACRPGSQACVEGGSGTWASCSGEVLPTAEVCNNVDDDCNGVVDDGLFRSCYDGSGGTRGVGVCSDGTQTCSAGSWTVSCPGEVLPSPEICDNLDNNCNGVVDEGLTRGCYDGAPGTKDVGLCHSGTQTCVAGGWGSTCPGEVTPVGEICNGADDDCNGVVDDIPATACYDGTATTRGVGACHDGTNACAASSPFAQYCKGEVLPTSVFSASSTTSASGATTFDYNCNGVEEKQFTATYACSGSTAGTCALGRAGWYGGVAACGKDGTESGFAWVTSCVWTGSACAPDTSSGRLQYCR